MFFFSVSQAVITSESDSEIITKFGCVWSEGFIAWFGSPGGLRLRVVTGLFGALRSNKTIVSFVYEVEDFNNRCKLLQKSGSHVLGHVMAFFI